MIHLTRLTRLTRLTNTDRAMLDCLEDGAWTLARHALDSGADPDARNERGEAAIHLAAKRCNFSMVAALLGAGADRDAVDPRGMTALDIATRSKSHFVVRALKAC